MEEEILSLWRKHQCFASLEAERKHLDPYVFYDGPPFATGKPHYGHVLAGTIKDVVTRYQCMKGKYVPRRFGWDCHGLPVENLVDKQLQIQSSKHETVDIATYNQECRKVVMQCEKDWEYTVERMGRWINFQNSYKTMDPDYMNGLWKIFYQLYEKGLIYQGWKVMPFSLSLGTPLSNFEANLNYKNVSQTDAYVLFPLQEDPTTCFLAWTTTPWTLLSHVALCVHPEKTYVVYQEESTGKKYIVSQGFTVPKGWTQVQETRGTDWKGIGYLAPFSYFPRNHQVVCDTYVKDDVGTGVIHLAPSFGEDDDRVCKAYGLSADTFPCPLTQKGIFTEEVGEFSGMHIHDAEKPILAFLKLKGLLWKQSTVVHSYPHCWRTDTPLIYRSVRSWFLHVEKIKDLCVEQNRKVHWIPEHIGEQRFHHWLEQAKDWALSRTRFWGTPIPVWTSEDGEEIVVISSAEELSSYTGKPVTDLHREYMDALEIPSRKGKGVLRRIPEVFDCWYESGAVPILQGNQPADFIAEGLDQTRGWFYTMLVLYTALYQEPPYKHVVCSGLVLAADGKKMSKRLQNYPDPLEIMEKYGADALRLYLLDSPVVKGETLRFKEEGVFAIKKEILNPLMNAVLFWETYASKKVANPASLSSPMDRWIHSYLHSFVQKMETDLASYRLWNLVGYMRHCVDIVTNIYVRMNRYRWKEGDPEASYTLFYVLETIAKTIAPIAPFLSEWMYQKLQTGNMESFASVHSQLYPAVQEVNTEELSYMEVFQRVVELGRKIRIQHKIPLKQPLSRMKVVYSQEQTLQFLETHMTEVMKQELNMEEVVLERNLDKYVTRTLVPHLPKIGKRFGKQSQEIVKKIAEGMIPEGVVLGEEVTYQYTRNTEEPGMEQDQDLLVFLELERTDRLKEEGELREYVSLVNRIRKDHSMKAGDVCHLRVSPLRTKELEEKLQQWVGENTILVFDVEEEESSYCYGEVCMKRG